MRDVPVRRLGDVLKKRRDRALGDEQLLSVTATRGVVRQSEAGRRDISSENKSNYRRVKPGDLVYNTMRMWQGVSGHSAYDGIVSPAYTVCSPTADADPAFLAHLLKLPKLVQKFENYSQGLVSDTWNLKYTAFSKITAPIPPLDEQRKIAEILDTVDEAIRSTERLIAKLRTTSLGLREHLIWEDAETSTLGTLIKTGPQNGLYKPAAAYSSGGEIDIVRIDSFDDGVIHAKDHLRKIVATSAELRAYHVQPGDILINRVNTPEIVGKAAIVETLARQTVFESNIMRIRILANLAHPKFVTLALCTNKARTHFRASAKSAIFQASINQADLRNCPVPSLSLDKQVRIIEELDSAYRRIETVLRQAQKLRAIKQGLMEDLLTGRVRVKVS